MSRRKQTMKVTMRKIMTTENQTPSTPKNLTVSRKEFSKQTTSKLEESKGNTLKPLSLRPNRSVKKSTSLKPLGLRSR